MYNLYIACYHRTKYICNIWVHTWYIQLYTWNPNDPSFDWKRPCFGGAKAKNRGHTIKQVPGMYYMLYVNVYADYVNFYIDFDATGPSDSTPYGGWYPMGNLECLSNQDMSVLGWFSILTYKLEEIRKTHQLLMVNIPLISSFFLHPRWLALGFFPSTVWLM